MADSKQVITHLPEVSFRTLQFGGRSTLLNRKWTHPIKITQLYPRFIVTTKVGLLSQRSRQRSSVLQPWPLDLAPTPALPRQSLRSFAGEGVAGLQSFLQTERSSPPLAGGERGGACRSRSQATENRQTTLAVTNHLRKSAGIRGVCVPFHGLFMRLGVALMISFGHWASP